MKPIPYGRQSISEEDIQEVAKILRSDFITTGPAVQEFEEAFSEYVGAKYAVACANGTAALHLCCLALDVGPADKYISTPISFAASTNCVLYCGGKVDFVDIDPESHLMDLSLLEEKLRSEPRGTYSGIIVVDFAGLPVNLEKVRALADVFNLNIIEDACHAPGGSFTDSNERRQSCGNCQFTDLSIFSFHPVKHITSGEGGMITTNDPALYKKLLYLRSHGITKDPELMEQNHGGWYYEMISLGFNYRLTDFQTALGLSQLKRAAAGIKRRNEIAFRYLEAFRDSSIKVQAIQEDSDHAYHLFVIRVENRKDLYDFLRSHHIYAQVHYIPIHLQPFYQKLGWKKGDFPKAEEYYEQCLSIPMYPGLKNDEQEYVIEKILEWQSSR